jgi:hypothetical protein
LAIDPLQVVDVKRIQQIFNNGNDTFHQIQILPQTGTFLASYGISVQYIDCGREYVAAIATMP